MLYSRLRTLLHEHRNTRLRLTRPNIPFLFTHDGYHVCLVPNTYQYVSYLRVCVMIYNSSYTGKYFIPVPDVIRSVLYSTRPSRGKRKNKRKWLACVGGLCVQSILLCCCCGMFACYSYSSIACCWCCVAGLPQALPTVVAAATIIDCLVVTEL